jgi:hypothetical protein
MGTDAHRRIGARTGRVYAADRVKWILLLVIMVIAAALVLGQMLNMGGVHP